ncbi:hypothetical protein EsVE80_21470 [Enterococcus saigonensis]|uniref:DUF4829 domain-containing protein n=1 Tax=Enterococcus saigonensis TaxID=1805431 RepID=A0A679IRA2_9ENTE|nr:hypothetical protein [Enterococcus saigonensis]BCA86624.1 hypothetical protein EsVE80_21470 [Enterococcus saigonensis]
MKQLKKQMLILFGIVAVAILLISFYKPAGKSDSVKEDFANSKRYSKTEIRLAATVVKDGFSQVFKNCRLDTLAYKEELQKYARLKTEKEIAPNTEYLLLTSTLYVGPDGYENLRPNTFYRNWCWYLKRVDKGEWQVYYFGNME